MARLGSLVSPIPAAATGPVSQILVAKYNLQFTVNSLIPPSDSDHTGPGLNGIGSGLSNSVFLHTNPYDASGLISDASKCLHLNGALVGAVTDLVVSGWMHLI